MSQRVVVVKGGGAVKHILAVSDVTEIVHRDDVQAEIVPLGDLLCRLLQHLPFFNGHDAGGIGHIADGLACGGEAVGHDGGGLRFCGAALRWLNRVGIATIVKEIYQRVRRGGDGIHQRLCVLLCVAGPVVRIHAFTQSVHCHLDADGGQCVIVTGRVEIPFVRHDAVFVLMDQQGQCYTVAAFAVAVIIFVIDGSGSVCQRGEVADAGQHVHPHIGFVERGKVGETTFAKLGQFIRLQSLRLCVDRAILCG